MKRTSTNCSIGLIQQCSWAAIASPHEAHTSQFVSTQCIGRADRVVIAKAPHPFPSRTRPLRPSAPMVLCPKAWESRRPVSGSVSLPSSGCFSPFPHGTGSLSVSKEYLAFEGGPPIFRQNFTCSALLNTSYHVSNTGLSPAMVLLPNRFFSHSRLGWSPFARRY